MCAVSFISTRNVDSPRARLSAAPTRQKTLSTIPMLRRGRRHEAIPSVPSGVMRATCRRNVDFPAMLGPVRMTKDRSVPRALEAVGNEGAARAGAPPPPGCRPSRMESAVPGVTFGRTYPCTVAANAKAWNTSSSESRRAHQEEPRDGLPHRGPTSRNSFRSISMIRLRGVVDLGLQVGQPSVVNRSPPTRDWRRMKPGGTRWQVGLRHLEVVPDDPVVPQLQ